MSDPRPINTARRKARQDERERLGLAVPPCVLCIQDHHVAYRSHDSVLTAPVCEMHHREIHEQLLRSGVSPLYEGNPVKRVRLALQAIAVFLRALAGAMDRMANLLDRSGGRT
jgi:hypothetical protein